MPAAGISWLALLLASITTLRSAPLLAADGHARSPGFVTLALPLGTPEESAACLACHARKDLELVLESGEVTSLHIDPEVLRRSVHATLECTDCHRDLKGMGDGHAAPSFPGARRLKMTLSEQCKRCHFANYTKTLDSVHYARRCAGSEKAAVCTDCHGAHDVATANAPRSKISRSCAVCHEEIAATYAASVHGKALGEEENPDVPVCTDCHRAHAIRDPRTASWGLRMPEMCGNCHANPKIAGKYGLSTKVLSTYLDSFHGTTASLELAENNPHPIGALCTDCHGVHDIARTDAPGSKVMQANLAETCRRCHEGAPVSFTAAWLSHYEPSLEKAPLVYLVKLFYAFLIPFVVIGLLLQIFLHLWRVVVNR
jgi:predicted CXXCH cytochrome family protein